MITCIIPARGGSKGIPKKNLLPINGKPLIAWSIEQALGSTLVDEVIVSSDSREIGEVAEHYGASWLMRSDATASDTASSESCLLEVLETLNYEPELIVFLQATSPIRQHDDIDNAIKVLARNKADSLFSCRHVEGYTWTCGPNVLTPNYYDRQPRQLLSSRKLEENGSIYLFKPEVLRKFHSRLGGNVAFYEMNPLDSFQLDRPEDRHIIEQAMAIRLHANLC